MSSMIRRFQGAVSIRRGSCPFGDSRAFPSRAAVERHARSGLFEQMVQRLQIQPVSCRCLVQIESKTLAARVWPAAVVAQLDQ